MSTIELSMIVKNGGPGLERCLRSVVPFVDRVIVGDTGSSDNSRDIAHGFGAEVIDVPWEHDFSKARNRVLAERKCDWILIVDADEMLDPESGRTLRELIENPAIFAVRHPVWHYVTDSLTRIGHQAARRNSFRLEEARPYPLYVPLPTVRVFRNHPEIYYENCVHETVEKRLSGLHLPSAQADIVVHHFGFVDNPTHRDAKNETYHKLGEMKLRAAPTDAQALIEMGISELEHRKNPDGALSYFGRARESAPFNAFPWLYSGVCFSRLRKADEALSHLNRAKELGLRTGVLFQAMADTHFQKGQFKEANQAYIELEQRGEDSPTSEAKRGACEVHLGQSETGLNRIQRAISRMPNSAELYDILCPAALLAGQPQLAIQAMQLRIPLGNLTDFHEEIVKLLIAKCNQEMTNRETTPNSSQAL